MRQVAVIALIMLAASAPAWPAEAEADSPRGETVETRALPGGGSRELVYRDGSLVEERVLDSSSALLAETLYAADISEEGAGRPPAPIESRKYLRSSNGRLERVEARDSDGKLTGSLDYRYDRSGRLLGIASTGSFGRGGAGMISAGGAPQGSWISDPATSTALSYDAEGRPLVMKTMKDGKAIAVERRIYGDGPSAERVESEDLIAGTLWIVENDSEGKPLLRIESLKGRETARVSYRYDDAGLLQEETTRDAAGGVMTRSLSYRDDGVLAREETRKDGTMMSAVEYIEGGRVDELYRGGELFVKATYLAGRKVKDEFYSGGKPTREKAYK